MKTFTARLGVGAVALALAAVGAPALAGAPGAPGHHGTPRARTVAALDGPRGVDALGHGRTLVTETGGAFSLVVEHKGHPAVVVPLGTLPTDFPPAIALGRHGTVWLLTGASGPPPEEEAASAPSLRSSLQAEAEPAPADPAAGATLYRWRHGWAAPKAFVDIAAYQAGDVDPYDQEDLPADSNPFGLAALRDGTVLVSDAAGNDLLRVWPDRDITTVARLKPRLVQVPAGLPDVPPDEGGPLPPAGTPILSEAVATSVAVGPDGYWYVGELRGFPATPGTSQVWRIRPGSAGALCDPEHPRKGACRRYADGLTSVVDLGASRRNLYAVSLSKASWLAMELGVPGSEVGGLFKIRRHAHHTRVRELVPGSLVMPGGVDAVGRSVYVTGPVFGPGALTKVR